ncbi:MAG: CBS domain-containing protein [Bacteroidota bacterium]
MNLYAPISEIMTTNLITVSPREKMTIVDKIFKEKRIHHIPVAETDGTLVGIISKTDYLKMHQALALGNGGDDFETLLDSYTAENIMTKGIAKLGENDRVDVAARIFKENLFHAIPIVSQENRLVGIVTTYDVINYCFKEIWEPAKS